MPKTIFAAGTVPWRKTKSGKIKVLLISRVKHKDWSFPKGKLDKGESLPITAVRETEEETGLTVRLGVNLGTINYGVGDNVRKTVQYWAARVGTKKFAKYEFEPNKEVKKIKWVPLKKVREKLTYPADKELFDVFFELATAGLHDTFSITVLRHAKAEPGSAKKRDSKRELTETGLNQAEIITPTLMSFKPKRIYSSNAKRCLQTATPLAKQLGRDVKQYRELSQDLWDEGETAGLRELIAQIADRQENAVICSHLPVIQDITREIAAAGKNRPGQYLVEAGDLPPAAFSVFHIAKKPSDHGIVTVEVYPIKVS